MKDSLGNPFPKPIMVEDGASLEELARAMYLSVALATCGLALKEGFHVTFIDNKATVYDSDLTEMTVFII